MNTLIDPDELARFHALLRERGIAPAAFELRQIDSTDPKSDEVLALRGTLSVLRRSTQRSHDYAIGDGSSWVDLFRADLDSGGFD